MTCVRLLGGRLEFWFDDSAVKGVLLVTVVDIDFLDQDEEMMSKSLLGANVSCHALSNRTIPQLIPFRKCGHLRLKWFRGAKAIDIKSQASGKERG